MAIGKNDQLIKQKAMELRALCDEQDYNYIISFDQTQDIGKRNFECYTCSTNKRMFLQMLSTINKKVATEFGIPLPGSHN